MSSFKRRVPTTPACALPQGTIVPPGTPHLHLSTGSAALDDVLGGGLPLGSSNLVLSSDPHTAYADVVLRYYVAQGLASGQGVLVVGRRAREWVGDCMWLPGGAAAAAGEDDEDEGEVAGNEEEAKGEARGGERIAWRYEGMKKFETSVRASSVSSCYLSTFDLTQRVPPSVLERAERKGLLGVVELDEPEEDEQGQWERVLGAIRDAVQAIKRSPDAPPLRVALRNLCSFEWGEYDSTTLFRFLHSLRAILSSTSSTALSTLPTPLLPPSLVPIPSRPTPFLYPLASVLSLTSFSASPHLASSLPSSAHGTLAILRSPASHTLAAPALRHSALRGLTAGAGENNLAFRLKRRRLVVETLHLDVEGGVGERRTRPKDDGQGKGKGRRLEVGQEERSEEREGEGRTETPGAKEGRKRVAFRSDKPELYEF